MKKIDVKAMIALMRPKQWTKNVFVFAAIIFSRRFTDTNLLLNNIIMFLLFCFASSSVYIFNDIIDADKDRKHPDKKNRPIASGKVSKIQGIILDLIILVSLSIITYKIDMKILIVILAYVIMNLFYSFKLKNVVIIDVMIITAGFLLRVESGSIISKVELSPWLLLCTMLLSLFLALNKRKGEIVALKEKSTVTRKILKEYSVDLIDKMLTIVTPSILIAYCLYTFSSVQGRNMMVTIPFVLYGIFRYQYLMEKENAGAKPEDVFTKDKPFLINIICWCVATIIVVYFKM
ncbi:Decaprenyl-phosphate phosphoribosyltransferase [Clostridium felsineum]|uniref:Decaprenyl-phosphate phosphoribosyltransferase n=1 Tax=Clostridium felsineum TaxID=36839 RepID=A0A1S8L4X8_9CLOT|nr:Decaprenyl-phosphate phosphoribosyltransferase [Clostridium felsineum]URZ06664.1 Decaprenyl-phosphate phosphoribosyltransferase [Clostridium felsineum]URZ11697.1 Decaprenyl-phosphate phosphoribosyltransferase [Clostridium felsineum]URZ16255.1 Decaprenyl-phosphate phosphoribosyltransferase [Clostridium felsineum DSM 794]